MGALSRTAWLSTAALALCAGGAARAQYDDGFGDIPNVSVEYYDVSGADVGAIRASMNARRPTDPRDGQPHDAVTSWHISFRYRNDPGGCHASQDPEFSAVVTLPRLANEGGVSSETLARWRRFTAALEAHEAGHARWAYEHLGDVKAALSAPSCAGAGAAGEAAIRRIALDDGAYDQQTRHGATQGAVFP